MEKIIDKFDELQRALKIVKIALVKMEKPSEDLEYRTHRDSLIQRFEYTFDTFWKYLKIYMQHITEIDIEVSSPRGVIREAKLSNLISDQETYLLLNCVDNRNDTSHGYRDSVAEVISHNKKENYEIMKIVCDRMNPKNKLL